MKGCCFIIENVHDKSGEAVCIKSQFINFTMNLKYFERTKYIAFEVYVKDDLNI